MSWLAVTDIVSFYATNVFLNSLNLSHNLSMDHFYRVISGSFELIFHHSVETICVLVEKLAKKSHNKRLCYFFVCGYVYCDPSDRISVVVIFDPSCKLYEFLLFVITVSHSVAEIFP